MTAYREYRIQLKDGPTGESIITAGGTVFVAQDGLSDKQTIYADANGGALSNPMTPTRGFINFFVLDTVSQVDLYIMAPGGQFEVRTGVKPGGPNEISVNTRAKRQMMKIPFSYVDQGGNATETDTGFDMPNPSMLLNRLHGCGLYVTAADSGITIDVGTGEAHPAESGGDANGLIAASSVASAVTVIGTDGALFSTNAPARSDAATAKSITWTLSTGADTAKGFILLPYQLI